MPLLLVIPVLQSLGIGACRYGQSLTRYRASNQRNEIRTMLFQQFQTAALTPA
jgi:hypothetical protein